MGKGGRESEEGEGGTNEQFLLKVLRRLSYIKGLAELV